MLAISQILYLGKEEKEDLHAAFLTWWGSIEKLLQDTPLKIPLQKNPNKQKPNPKQAWEHWYPHSFMGYRLYSVFLLKRTTVKPHSSSVWAHTVKVVRMVSFVFAQLKGSDCVGARARNKKGSSPVHGGAVAASACDHKKKDKPQDKVRALKFLFVTSRYHKFDINRQDQWMSSSTLHSNLNLQSTKNGARLTS